MSENPVVHFEMPYEDASRVVKFYEDAFGWQLTDAGEGMGNYLVAVTADTDENMMVTTPGTINGGFYPTAPESAEPSVVIAVSDAQAAAARITAAGGEVLGEPQSIPGIGLWASFRDSEGNRVSILQAEAT